MKVLLIEDNIQISKNIVRFLALKDISCDMALDGKDGLHKALVNHYDVIILDINLPLLNGLEVLKSLRERQKDSQIIMLTSNSLKQDIINGLNLGADDYMTKPFDFEELLARLHTLNRRNLKNKSNIINFGKDFIMDIEKTEVRKNNDLIKLSNLEFNLLKYLIQNTSKTISRQELYQKVWGEFDGDIMFSKTVDVYIGYLRKKVGFDMIQTVKGVGYKIN
ncbi:MAG: response regulator transcription factor [Candidatus Gracilibacteria bacterium]|nr:response regulator transcription factor [Candidatus Gracilibacteria bacterium]